MTAPAEARTSSDRRAAVIPASGSAARLDGLPKLLLPIADTTVLGWTCRAFLGAGIAKIVIVARYDDDDLLAWCQQCGLEVAENLKPELGMLPVHPGVVFAIWGGAEALAARSTDLLVSPGDLPALQPLSVRSVLLAADLHPDALVVPTHNAERGHPLRIPPALIGEVFDLNLESGLRQILEEHASSVHVGARLEDPGVILDLDTDADYRRLRDRIETATAS